MTFSLNRDSAAIEEFQNRDMSRILKLPFNEPISEELQYKFSKATLFPNAEIPSLLPTQVEALVGYIRNSGLFGYIAVGGGKSLISFASAATAYRKGIRKMILLVPPKLAPQTVDKSLPWVRKQLPINYPVHVLAGKNALSREKISQKDTGLFIMAWSQLSLDDTDMMIENISPELIIADEAHNLSNKSSSRYKRVNRWMVQNPETEFIALSGTMGKKSIMDYYHIIQWCLKENTPLPETLMDACNWSNVLDTTFSEYTSSTLLYPILDWARRNGLKEVDRDIAGYRKAYNYRLRHSSGVVFAVGGGISTEITFKNRVVPVDDNYEGYKDLKEIQRKVHEENCSPSGDEIKFDLHKFKYDYELSAGFYSQLQWPSIEKIMKGRKVSKMEAQDLLFRSQEHHEARQRSSAITRRWLAKYADRGLDTPQLLGTNMLHHGPKNVGDDMYDAWQYMRSLYFPEIIERDRNPIRVCDYKVKDCLKWAKELERGKGGLVWYKNIEMGKWCYEVLIANGVDAVLCDATPMGSYNMNNEGNGKKVLVASVTAYREGIDWLQRHQNEVYFLQIPREAHFIEQALGRHHRTGCVFDNINYTTNMTTKFDKTMFSAVLADALFQSQAGTPCKLITGNHEVIPELASAATLKEMNMFQKGCRSIDEGLMDTLRDVLSNKKNTEEVK